MTSCDQIRSRALVLAALPPTDPAAVAAAAHVRTCPACAKALQEAIRLLKHIDDELRPSPPPEAVLQRAEAALLRQMDREDRSSVRLRTPVFLASGVLLAFGILSGLSRHRAMDA